MQSTAGTTIAAKEVHNLLLPGRALREIEADVYSALPPEAPGHPYDARARIYDLVVARRLYSRLIWGADRDDYAAFEQLAVDGPRSGWMLDAGCGSLVFTHQVYARYQGPPIVLVDRSLGMLRRARRRLVRAGGRVPASAVFVQADLLDLPFRPASFEAVSCPALLHLFADPVPLVGALCKAVQPGSGMYFTSLVLRPQRRFATRYLRWLERNGEVATPRTVEEAADLLALCPATQPLYATARGNMAYFSNRPFWEITTPQPPQPMD